MHLGTKVQHIYCGRKTTSAPLPFEAKRKQMKGAEVSTQGSKSLLVKGIEKSIILTCAAAEDVEAGNPGDVKREPANLSNLLCLLLMNHGAF